MIIAKIYEKGWKSTKNLWKSKKIYESTKTKRKQIEDPHGPVTGTDSEHGPGHSFDKVIQTLGGDHEAKSIIPGPGRESRSEINYGTVVTK